ncbi:hypothetical protein EST38_g6055 [Candolleomyces aberdarensis]|uniref:Uncharacterized protein n=1 Tax=Candolleomyces aberdarensis TaxID=2316362 RepID=A0A4Q2DIT0_9AGAR|nr:hypothetical protein EST38_g6055 [Candolleomyces aberdarensis]
MPPKYSHVKKRSAAGLLKPGASTPNNLIRETYDPNNPHGHQQLYQQHIQLNNNHFPILGIQPNSILPKIDKELSQAMAAVAHLERAIAKILLLRYEYDIARLYSTRVHVISITQIPILVARLTELCGPGWIAHNSENEEIKDFFRAIIGMDMREAGERVATKSVLWSYTALRRFALAHNVPICAHRGLQSLRLLPFYPDLKAHLDSLEAKAPFTFEKPAFFSGLEPGYRALEEACVKLGMDLGIDIETGKKHDLTIPSSISVHTADDEILPTEGSSMSTTTTHVLRTLPQSNPNSNVTAVSYTLTPAAELRLKLRLGYTRLVQTLWKVSREFDVRGYGGVLRDKLTIKWCECGCSTEHLGEVCEKTVREEEEDREEHGEGIWGGGDITVDAYGPLKVDESLLDPKAKGSTAAFAAQHANSTLQIKDANPRRDGKRDGSRNPSSKKGKASAAFQDTMDQENDDDDKEKRYARLKEKEWDGRGSGVFAWETFNEEDIWEADLDFGTGKNGRGRRRKKSADSTTEDEPPSPPPIVFAHKIPRSVKRKKKASSNKTPNVYLEDMPLPSPYHEDPTSNDEEDENPFEEEEAQMTIGEMMEWRYIKAEQEKEKGNLAFRDGHYVEAVDHYRKAQEIEPELPHYQLNMAAAYLKLNKWMEAEQACTRALNMHRSSKGLFRRAKARQMLGKVDDAIQDYRALIRLQPYNTEAMIELLSLLHPPTPKRPPESAITPNDNPWDVNLKPETDTEFSALYEKLGMTKPKRLKPVPFQRTSADSLEIQIVAIDPRNETADGALNGGVEEGGANGDVKGKLKSGKVRGKEKKEEPGRSGIMRSIAAEYGISYFAWDRYAIRLAEDA